MCQEADVVAIATLTPKDGKIVYKGSDGTSKEAKIDIQKSGRYYGGEISSTNNNDLKELREALQNSSIQKLKPRPSDIALFKLMIIHTGLNDSPFIYMDQCRINCYDKKINIA